MMSRLFANYQQLRQETDALLAFQMGSFFEFYDDDARIVSRVCNIGLSRRGSRADGQPRAMCGIPADGRFPTTGQSAVQFLGSTTDFFQEILEAGHALSVAVQRQDADGLWRREIVVTVRPDSGALLKLAG